jgi:pimeloyl-ACP methyl ester carboxylesterase
VHGSKISGSIELWDTARQKHKLFRRKNVVLIGVLLLRSLSGTTPLTPATITSAVYTRSDLSSLALLTSSPTHPLIRARTLDAPSITTRQSTKPGTPISRLVLNDIGPFISKSAIARIAGYVGKDPRFASLAEAEAYLRSVHATFGDLSDDQWAHLAAWSAVAEEDGSYRLHYDPAIAKAFSSGPSEDVSLWPVWEAVCCPTLVVRGAKSELLTADTASEMVRRGAAGAAGAVRVAEIAGVGHAPALMSEHQIALLCEFLAEGFSS